MKKLLLVDSKVLPDVYEKVVMAKQLLVSGKAKGVSDAVKKSGISRSSYYKYKDFVFDTSDTISSNIATMEFSLKNVTGILSEILEVFAKQKASILTINQTIPINGVATLTITADISQMLNPVATILDKIKQKNEVLEVKLLAME
ncbi:ACT domain-containing protein [Criibacterium bergeronii]|uniref:UPF0735 ACT domain-containing protein BBG48_003530 n=1 Tax=Criibacterium bergeronii TaxID=1871336 RepID=A0A371IMD8_9FIRM|nr:ACT domain-containing protein [Criibacterium bergeronii]MBS6062316.1 ACT domain-containing protein [Peptostreptococcaceae bacterium]RDY21665.1 ACT domain-containing protein [Criibacterium bergeronii]TRW28573.1 ACT domain-containing protein [Criibacterium bergeronii]